MSPRRKIRGDEPMNFVDFSATNMASRDTDLAALYASKDTPDTRAEIRSKLKRAEHARLAAWSIGPPPSDDRPNNGTRSRGLPVISLEERRRGVQRFVEIEKERIAALQEEMDESGSLAQSSEDEQPQPPRLAQPSEDAGGLFDLLSTLRDQLNTTDYVSTHPADWSLLVPTSKDGVPAAAEPLEAEAAKPPAAEPAGLTIDLDLDLDSAFVVTEKSGGVSGEIAGLVGALRQQLRGLSTPLAAAPPQPPPTQPPAEPTTAAREARLFHAASRRVGGVHCVLERLEDRGNRAAILRSVEALGLLNVHEIATASPERGRARGVAHGGEKWLYARMHSTADECRAALKGVRLLAALPPVAECPASASWHSLGGRRRRKRGGGSGSSSNRAEAEVEDEDDGGAEEDDANDAAHEAAPPRPEALLAAPIALEDIDFSQPVALAFGNERLGLSPEFLAVCDGAFHIPLHGLTESLNVSVAVAISLHHARLARCAALRGIGSLNAQGGDLDEAAVEELLSEYRSRGRGFAKKAGGGSVAVADLD